ncbi:hypothetical protein EDC01DRAFT_102533 [Geopyxis carbonaria]|nr:hypothetical protein EDC01DRAFT_102533 [Geopyxis carbonaria]
MARILLSGASGFIASHVLDILLAHGHSVRITVRSAAKAEKLIAAHPEHASQIDYAIVADIAAPGAFDEAVKSDPPFTAVIHTASPFHFNVTNVQTQLLDPAIRGTTSILEAIYAHAPTVTRVVITSSFAAIIDASRGLASRYIYSEADWNPITHAQALESPSAGYRASKTLAEKAAWEFVATKKPNFSVATVNPPLVLGPVKPYLADLEHINTSNERTLNMLRGAMKDGLAPTGTYLWVDVRDVAAAHVAAAEKEEAGGERFFVVEGLFSNQLIADVIREGFPEFAGQLPENREPNDGYPADGVYTADNSKSKKVLGLKYKPLKESITDLVVSLKEMGV